MFFYFVTIATDGKPVVSKAYDNPHYRHAAAREYFASDDHNGGELIYSLNIEMNRPGPPTQVKMWQYELPELESVDMSSLKIGDPIKIFPSTDNDFDESKVGSVLDILTGRGEPGVKGAEVRIKAEVSGFEESTRFILPRDVQYWGKTV